MLVYAGKCLKHFGVRRIAEVKNLDGFGRAVGISNDSLGIFVGNFGQTDVGPTISVAGGGVARLGAMIHQARQNPVWSHQSP